MYERDEFLRDRIRPHQPGTPRGYSPRPTINRTARL
ncbi:hypothetical protein, partial [Mycobacterium tuberculosis]